MADTGYVYYEMFDDIFSNFPEILEILWREDKKSKPELRINTSLDQKPYVGGKNSEFDLASPELKKIWPDVVSTLGAEMLIGWGSSPNKIYKATKGDY